MSLGFSDVTNLHRLTATFSSDFVTCAITMSPQSARTLSRHLVLSLVICSTCTARSSLRKAKNEPIQPPSAAKESHDSHDTRLKCIPFYPKSIVSLECNLRAGRIIECEGQMRIS